jgi:hypothetical protein
MPYLDTLSVTNGGYVLIALPSKSVGLLKKAKGKPYSGGQPKTSKLLK